MAKILGVKEIPVKVTVRHTDWVQFRDSLQTYVQAKNASLSHVLFHPDLTDILVEEGYRYLDT